MSTMTIAGTKPGAKRTVRDSIRFHLMLGLGIVLVLSAIVIVQMPSGGSQSDAIVEPIE